MEFGSLGSLELERRARPVRTWAVDKSVDNVDNWEFGEFGASEVVEKSRPFEANLMKKK